MKWHFWRNISKLTNNRTFGSYILAPVPAGQATDINAVFYFKKRPILKDEKWKFFKRVGYLDGIQASAFAANQLWHYDSTFTGADSEIVSVNKELRPLHGKIDSITYVSILYILFSVKKLNFISCN